MRDLAAHRSPASRARRRLAPAALAALCVQLLAAGSRGGVERAAPPPAGDEAHAELFAAERYPSAQKCRTCHPDHYREWSVSQHAYAQLSPVFNAMQATIVSRTSGSNGDFCIRCHTEPGMALGEPVLASNLDRSPIAREGVTCVVCHRVNESYGKVSGRRALVEGGLEVPVKGPTGNAELRRVIASPEYPVVTEPGEPGRLIHGDVETFFALQTPGFCGACHDVTLPTGFRLEEAFSEYKSSPAAARGVTCQDCHMGVEPGVPSGYRTAPAALVGGVPTRPRKRTNHMWVGPDYSVIHAGLFPHNPAAERLATGREWLAFDDEAGWGSEAFERSVGPDVVFPPRWASADDRYDARELLEEQHALLARATADRLALLRRGYVLGDVVVERADPRGLAFRVEVRNGTDGHNVPTGFTAERIVFLRVTATDRDGRVVLRSGDFDPNGDLRDSHSEHVRDGRVPLDRQLLSLQSKFLTRNLRGGEREQILAVNHSLDPLPFVRPQTYSTVLLGRNVVNRLHKRNIEPGGSRWGEYRTGRGEAGAGPPYRIAVELVAGMVPVNLVREVQDAGFDYGMSPRQVAERVLAGYMTLWQRELVAGDDARAGGGTEHERAPALARR